jgi:hypothetical protein
MPRAMNFGKYSAYFVAISAWVTSAPRISLRMVCSRMRAVTWL